MLPPRLTAAVVVVVTGVWLASFILAATYEHYQPDPQVNLIFMGIVGGALALKGQPNVGGPSKGAS